MINPLIQRLEHAVALTAADRATLNAIVRQARTVDANVDVMTEGERPKTVHLMMSGLAYRYKDLIDGRRQILAILVPGDICHLHVAILGEIDHSIATASPCTFVDIPSDAIRDLAAQNPRIAHGLWWSTLVDEAILREWLVNMGQRSADQRIAHVFCELLVRLQAVGRATENSYEFPLSQRRFGDLLGLTDVHVNRTLQSLRERQLIKLKGSVLTIPDVPRLKAFAGFNARYLHLTRRHTEVSTDAGAIHERRD